ncbi:MAG: GntR family transcriptional regulator [Sebaldella sp.]|nr:GntR family transcriptional regulator [Sebaldella sp.]
MKFYEIEEYLLNNIKKSFYLPDEKIESENELVKKFGVSRMTCRKAIENLVQRNYLYKIKGKGTYVKDNSNKHIIYLNETIGFSERTKRENLNPVTKVLKYEERVPEDGIREKLRLKKEEKIVYLKRLRFINNEPVVVEITYIPIKFINEKKLNEFFESKYNYALGENYKIIEMQKEYMGILPSRDIKELLEIKGNVPVFKQEITSILADGEIFEYTKAFYNQEKYKFLEILKKNIDKY